MANLGSTIAQTVTRLTDLILEETDGKRRKVLQQHQRELLRSMAALVSKTVPEDTKAYERATEALTTVNESIREAIEDNAKVAKVIKDLGKVLDLVAKVVAI